MPPGNGTVPTWLTTMVVAVIAAVAALAVSTGPHAAQAQPSEDPALLRELAERLLGSPGPGPRGAELPPPRLLVGALPANLPFDVPLPPGSRLVGSVVRPSFGPGPVPTPSGESVEVVLDAPGAAREVLAFYDRAFVERGLSMAPQSGRGQPPGGFLPTAGILNSALYCQSEQGPFVSLNVFPKANGPNDVRIHIETGSPGPCSGPPLPPRGRLPGPPDDPLPPLEAPSGVQLQMTGGSFAPFLRTSEAFAETEASVAELEAHYAAQLAAAGWRRLDGRAEGSLAWSLWQLPGDEERQGFLYVLAGPGPNRRTLHVQVASAVMTGGPAAGGVVTVTAPAPPPPRR